MGAEKWWQSGVIYQIYPRSFADSDGDGIGDLQGIVSKLDYLQWLGIDAIWISPIYPSPMADFGYDVSNYTDVHPMFGTLEDFDELVEEAHSRDLKVILDFVPNHTSDEHPWFVESRSSRDSPKRDWYIWAEPALDGGPPNNWLSVYGEAWEWDEKTEQYYYHAYLKEQPDLNWRNPEVREAMYDAMRFWLDRGVDGFRVDALRHLFKDEGLRDEPANPDYEGESGDYELLPIYTTDLPEVQDAVRQMRTVLDEYSERAMIGELYLPIERLMIYYDSGMQLPSNMHLLLSPWDAREISSLIERYEGALPSNARPNWVLSNHDRPRTASKVGEDQARVAAMLLLTLRGTPTLYYGDEIRMQNVPISSEKTQDPWAENDYGGRDPFRTPMQWNATPNAGFTIGEPWLPPADDYADVNVEQQAEAPDSLLNLYRRLLDMRRAEPALSIGSYEPFATTGNLLAYVREHQGRRYLIVLNFSSILRRLDLRELRGSIKLSTCLDCEGKVVQDEIELREDEGIVIELDGS